MAFRMEDGGDHGDQLCPVGHSQDSEASLRTVQLQQTRAVVCSSFQRMH